MTSNKKKPQPEVSDAVEPIVKKAPKIQTAEGWKRAEAARKAAEKGKK